VKTHRASTRLVRRTAAPLCLLLVIALLAAACGGNAHAGRQPTVAASRSPHIAAVAISPGLLTAYFPVSGEEIDAPSPIYDLVTELSADAESACMKADGWKDPGYYGIGPTHVETMPDLAYIATHGFEIISPAPASAYQGVLAGSADTAFSNDLGHCDSLPVSPAVQRFQDAIGPISGQWMTESNGVQGDPAVIHAYVGLDACIRSHGINEPDEDGFFDYDQMVTNSGNPDGTDEMAKLLQIAHVYITCISPVEAVRLKIRTSLRQTFLSDNAGAVEQAQAAANALLRTYPAAVASLSAKP
jgi:hypothetical protein